MRSIRRWGSWLRAAWPAWVTLAAFFLPAFPPLRSETAIRILGAVYQVAGILVVVFGINDKLKHFHGYGITASMRIWWRSRPWKQLPAVNVSGNLVAGAATARGYGTASGADKRPLEEQVAELQRRLTETEQRINARIDSEVETLGRSIAEVSASVPTRAAGLKQDLGALLAGGFKVELVGAALLVFGVVFGTLPGEVAAAVRCAWNPNG